MSTTIPNEWMLPARKYMATGKTEFLEEARANCRDAVVSSFLNESSVEECQVSPEIFQPIESQLTRKRRNAEASLVKILSMGALAAAAGSPERFSSAKMAKFAVSLCSDFAVESQRNGFQECEAFFVGILGTFKGKKHRWDDARKFLLRALELYRALAEKEPHIYLPDVARTLNNLGVVLHDMRQFPAAEVAHKEGLETYRALAEKEPHIYLPDVAMTLNNLGNVFRDMRQFPAAEEAYKEGLEIRRALAEKEPRIYLPSVAVCLNNLGNVHSAMRQFPAAEAAYKEGLEIRRALAEKEPRIYLPDVAMTLNNLGAVLEQRNQQEDALKYSIEAIKAAENTHQDDKSRLFLAKGQASGAYRRFLANCLEKEKPDDVFRCLAALREGHVRALGSSDEEGLASAQDALLRIKKDIGETVHFLIVQSLTGEDAVLSILDGKKPLFHLRNREFYKVSQELFGEVIDTIENPRSRNAKERIMKMRELGIKAWQALPGEIQQILNPRSGGHLLISGDSYWSAFPWEGLCFGPGDEDWLGLHRSLCRWGPLTAKGLGGLRRMVFGNGQKTAAIIAPWNAPHTLPLERTRQEAEEIEKKLKGLKYVPSTDRFLYPGEYATRESTAGVFLATPTIIHYTGHGAIFQNEEVLVLWRERSPGEREEMAGWAPFGRREITDIKTIANKK